MLFDAVFLYKKSPRPTEGREETPVVPPLLAILSSSKAHDSLGCRNLLLCPIRIIYRIKIREIAAFMVTGRFRPGLLSVLPGGSGGIFGELLVSGFTNPGLSITRECCLLAPSLPIPCLIAESRVGRIRYRFAMIAQKMIKYNRYEIWRRGDGASPASR